MLLVQVRVLLSGHPWRSVAALRSPGPAIHRRARPFELSLAVNFAYYAVVTATSLETPKVAAFHGWLLEEAVLATHA